jgi:hypothetical protein
MKNVFMFLVLVFSTNFAFAQSQNLKNLVKAYEKSHSDADWKKAIAQLKKEAELAKLDIERTLLAVELSSETVTSLEGRIARSERRAADLRIKNNVGIAIILLAQSITAEIDQKKIEASTNIALKEISKYQELAVPGYTQSAYNRELNRCAQVLGDLYFYY